jgi:hypothetical protein
MHESAPPPEISKAQLPDPLDVRWIHSKQPIPQLSLNLCLDGKFVRGRSCFTEAGDSLIGIDNHEHPVASDARSIGAGYAHETAGNIGDFHRAYAPVAPFKPVRTKLIRISSGRAIAADALAGQITHMKQADFVLSTSIAAEPASRRAMARVILPEYYP